MRPIRKNFQSQGLSEHTVNVIMNSWRKSTKLQYRPYIRLWIEYATNRCNYLSPSIAQVVEFLSQLHQKKYTYYQLCMARSAISNIVVCKDNVPLGKQLLVKRFMKGVFEMNPHFPRYRYVWDVSLVLNYFRSLPKPKYLPMGLLGKKLAMMLVILAGGQRCQTIHAIDTLHIKVTHDKCFIPLYSTLKQTRHGHHLKPLEFQIYAKEPKLCVIENLTQYLKKTSKVRQEKQLFISYQKPHRGVSKDSIARWCKEVMTNAGIDMTSFVSHSSRSAASSYAHAKGASLKDICAACGWATEKTFALHYKKRILNNKDITTRILH